MRIYETLSSETFWLAFCLALVSCIIIPATGTGSATRAPHNAVVNCLCQIPVQFKATKAALAQ